MSDDNVSLSNFIARLKDKVLSFNFLKVVFIVVLGIVLLYVVSNVYVSSDDNVNALTSNTDNKNVSYPKYLSTIEYASYLEDKLEILFSNMQGVGSVSAMVSLDGSSTFNYATTSSNNASSNNIIFVESGGEKYPLVLSEYLPNVASVTLVCMGLTDEIKVDIIRSVSTMFQLSTDCVYVLKG
ncbi:MAG: hypothetical protein J6V40_05550 [Clostridia bacterium]|nr:hypothetical protein [Clostridia bacterium]